MFGPKPAERWQTHDEIAYLNGFGKHTIDGRAGRLSLRDMLTNYIHRGAERAMAGTWGDVDWTAVQRYAVAKLFRATR